MGKHKSYKGGVCPRNKKARRRRQGNGGGGGGRDRTNNDRSRRDRRDRRGGRRERNRRGREEDDDSSSTEDPDSQGAEVSDMSLSDEEKRDAFNDNIKTFERVKKKMHAQHLKNMEKTLGRKKYKLWKKKRESAGGEGRAFNMAESVKTAERRRKERKESRRKGKFKVSFEHGNKMIEVAQRGGEKHLRAQHLLKTLARSASLISDTETSSSSTSATFGIDNAIKFMRSSRPSLDSGADNHYMPADALQHLTDVASCDRHVIGASGATMVGNKQGTLGDNLHNVLPLEEVGPEGMLSPGLIARDFGVVVVLASEGAYAMDRGVFDRVTQGSEVVRVADRPGEEGQYLTDVLALDGWLTKQKLHKELLAARRAAAKHDALRPEVEQRAEAAVPSPLEQWRAAGLSPIEEKGEDGEEHFR